MLVIATRDLCALFGILVIATRDLCGLYNNVNRKEIVRCITISGSTKDVCFILTIITVDF